MRDLTRRIKNENTSIIKKERQTEKEKDSDPGPSNRTDRRFNTQTRKLSIIS